MSTTSAVDRIARANELIKRIDELDARLVKDIQRCDRMSAKLAEIFNDKKAPRAETYIESPIR